MWTDVNSVEENEIRNIYDGMAVGMCQSRFQYNDIGEISRKYVKKCITQSSKVS